MDLDHQSLRSTSPLSSRSRSRSPPRPAPSLLLHSPWPRAAPAPAPHFPTSAAASPPPLSVTTATPLTINVGGRLFVTLRSTLDRSPFLAAFLSDRWAATVPYLDGVPFVDRAHDLFDHVLDFLRTAGPPIFWSRANGFDLPLYARLLQEADYYQLHVLAAWIRDEKYTEAIRITSSTDLHSLDQCQRGLPSYSADVEMEFRGGNATTVSKSGKTITYWKPVDVRRTKLVPPMVL